MSKHIELATPCPNCQSRLTLSVRRTPLMGFFSPQTRYFNAGLGRTEIYIW